MADKVKAGTIKEFLKKMGEPFRKEEQPKEGDEESEPKEESEPIKLEDLTPKKKVPKGMIDAAKSIRKSIGQ